MTCIQGGKVGELFGCMCPWCYDYKQLIVDIRGGRQLSQSQIDCRWPCKPDPRTFQDWNCWAKELEARI